MDFVFAPIQMINIGPNDTFGNEFSIVRYGSITFAMNLLYQSIIAIIIPNIVPSEKLIIVSYVVVHIWLNRLLSLYNFIIVSNTFFGDDVIKVFIISLFARYCHSANNSVISNIWHVSTNNLFIFSFFRYFLYSLDILINIFPDFFVVCIKFFACSVINWCCFVC